MQNTKALLSLTCLWTKPEVFTFRTIANPAAPAGPPGHRRGRKTGDVPAADTYSQIHSPKTDTLFVYFLRNLFREPACPLRSLLFPIPCSSCSSREETRDRTEERREEKEEESFPVHPQGLVHPLLSFLSARAAKGAHRRDTLISADPPHLHLPKRNSKKTIF